MCFFIHLITRSSGGSNNQLWNGDEIIFWINSNNYYDMKISVLSFGDKSQILLTLLCFVRGNAMLLSKISKNKDVFFSCRSFWSLESVVPGFPVHMWVLCVTGSWSGLLQSIWYADIFDSWRELDFLAFWLK